MKDTEKFKLAADVINQICDNFDFILENEYQEIYDSEEFEELQIAVDRFKYLVTFSS